MDQNDIAILKDSVTIASPLIKTLIDTFVTPKLVSFRDKFKIKKELNVIPTEEHFTEYYHRTYKRLAVVNTLVFNNSQRFLKDIYLPLTITANSPRLSGEKSKITGFPSKLSNKYGNILITDTAGMGKSTIMKIIFLDILNKNLGIPIFIELRRLSRQKRILDEIKEQLSSIDKSFDNNLIQELLGGGGFVIILDGYDEIPLIERDKVTSDIQEFLTKASENRFFITSRPETALTSFGNFQEFKIEPLTKREAFELVRKYDNQGPISSLLVKKLEEEDMSNIEEFLTNPLLVSLLFTAFEHKQTIPFKKYLFYRQVYDANFELHDLTKGESYIHNKYSKLEIDDFHRVLRHIGFSCLKNQKIEFTKDEILKLISESRKFCVGLNFNESDFLLDIIKTVPLFTQDGNYYRWAHKSLQEYFAAQSIYLDSKDRQTAILQSLYNSKKFNYFVNVLDLYYDMDYKVFRNVIELLLLREYFEHCEKFDLDQSTEIDTGSIILRKEITFLNEGFIFKSNKSLGLENTDSEISKLINSLTKERNSSFGGYSGGITVLERGDKFLYLNIEFPRMSLLNLLHNKKNALVKSINKPKEKPINYTPKQKYKPELITEIELKRGGLKSNYSSINSTLIICNANGYTINHEVALIRFNEILEGIAYDANDDFFSNMS